MASVLWRVAISGCGIIFEQPPMKVTENRLPNANSTSMKNILLISAVIFSFATFGQEEALGKWTTVDDKTAVRKSIVEVYKKDGRYHAKVIRMLYRDQDTICENCEGELKNQKVVGMDIISDMKYSKRDKAFYNAVILNPESGKTYEGKIWVENGKLMVRGYLFFFYRTQAWERYVEGE